MLTKLLKHEFKNSYLEICIINAAIIFLSIISGLTFNTNSMSLIVIPLMALLFLYFAAAVLLLINLIKSFNQNLFTKEGYLTLTLPVSIDKIIISKMIVNIIWWFISGIIIVSSIVITAIIITKLRLDNFAIVLDNFDGMDFISILFFVINLTFNLLYFFVLLFFVLTLLNIGKIRKFKLLLGVGIYYLISIFVSMIKMIQIIPFAMYNDNGRLVIYNLVGNILEFRNYGFQLFNFNNIFFNIVFIIIFYLLTRLLITKKLELE